MARRSQVSLRVTKPASPTPVLRSLLAYLDPLSATWRDWLPKALLIVGLTFWIYWPSLRGEFIWDDQWYITLNPLLPSPTGLAKIWFEPGSWVEYYPIEETVLWVQWHLFGTDTLGYHLTNVFLHLVSAFLVWNLLGKFGMRSAWVGGLIFAIHPVQVDSVAYICELKNTLSLPFFLLAMIAWIDYDAGQSKRDYRRALLLFLAAMLCKITMAPFAAVILLYAWWKRGRIEWSDIKNCAPFLLLAAILCFVTIGVGSVYERNGHEPIATTPLDGPLSRIAAAGMIATVYFSRCFLPIDIPLVYPQWRLHPHSPIQYLPWLLLAVVLSVFWSKRRTWGRHALLGLGFFLIILSPFVGFVPVSYMNFTWFMDHMLYIPIIGLIGLVVAGMEGIYAQIPIAGRRVAVVVFALAVAATTCFSQAYAGLYVNEQVFWTHILQRNPTVWLAHANLGAKFMELERFQDALAQEKEALLLRPNSADDFYNLAFSLEKLGREQDAQAAYHKALIFNPNNPKIYLNLGEMMRHDGKLADAEAEFRAGLKVSPDDASLCTDLAGILVQSGRGAEAIALYEKTLRLNPDYAQLQYDLGVTLLQAGRLPEAEEHLEAAVTLDPKIAAAHENLGATLAQLGRLSDAIDQFDAALQINSGLVAARNDLALALAQTGRVPEAIDQFKCVLQVDPNNSQARDSLAKLQQFEMQQTVPSSH
jgi:tetratricopeptide (TPR) repeat protein